MILPANFHSYTLRKVLWVATQRSDIPWFHLQSLSNNNPSVHHLPAMYSRSCINSQETQLVQWVWVTWTWIKVNAARAFKPVWTWERRKRRAQRHSIQTVNVATLGSSQPSKLPAWHRIYFKKVTNFVSMSFPPNVKLEEWLKIRMIPPCD